MHASSSNFDPGCTRNLRRSGDFGKALFSSHADAGNADRACTVEREPEMGRRPMTGPRRRSRVHARSRIITREVIDAYKREDGMALHVAPDLRPWQISPLRVAGIPEPPRDTKVIFLQSWWLASQLRDELEEAIARGD
jgi:hypothetical protein